LFYKFVLRNNQQIQYINFADVPTQVMTRAIEACNQALAKIPQNHQWVASWH